ncbi:clathrin interactor EPSIN 1 [Vitis vinifera]|nr:clathrin interactor EPSIN 1 [Vitis vinifera]XP_019074924.1 clathrin interactor EPSIN 1 [Vitis vinifera]|eukprot:XP_002276103.1 PREDICTED: clathrin interactor EPSIN 1 [Vitis vinifera]
MDFMKVFDQTVREIKREVNLKVLKVPEIEQKVLDATDNEPWGPHGSALAEIAQATKKFTECQMVMNVLWTRLSDSGRDWRHVYKSLAVIEYLVANGSERAVDDIIEHTFQISSLSGFEYVEPNGKDVGINVRKKAETIVALLNNKEKIQEVRNKAAANRDKFFGLSSSGVTYKSSSAPYGSSSFQSADQHGGMSSKRENDSFRDSYKDRDRFDEEKVDEDTSAKSRQGVTSENEGNTFKKGSARYSSKDKDTLSTKANYSDKYGSIPSHSSSVPSINDEDDFDDFDPRGTSSTKTTAGNINQPDLFGQSLIGDLMDAPAPVPTEMSAINSNSAEPDLFADATFVSAPPHVEEGSSSQVEAKVDLFGSQPAGPSANPPAFDFFAAPDPVVQSETKSQKSDTASPDIVDPFAAVPLNSFDGSDLFGSFTSHTNSASTEPTQSPANDGNLNNLNGKSSAEFQPPPKKDAFQVKSGIWADSLSRGLIDLNISAPKKINLADVGIVGGLSDGSDEREKGPQTSFSMGQAMGIGSGLGKSGFTSPPTGGVGGDDIFSSLGSQQYQFGGFKK